MALALEARAMKDDMMLGDTPKARKRRRKLKDVKTRGRLWKHSTLADIDGLVSPEEIAGYFCFTLVRNPWDRMVSYYHWLRLQSFDHPAVKLAQQLDFNAFVLHEHTRASLRANPASRYLTDANGTEHDGAYVRIEHFEQDVAPVVAKLGFEIRLERANATERDRDWRKFYSDEAAESVLKAAESDAMRFKYTLDG